MLALQVYYWCQIEVRHVLLRFPYHLARFGSGTGVTGPIRFYLNAFTVSILGCPTF